MFWLVVIHKSEPLHSVLFIHSNRFSLTPLLHLDISHLQTLKLMTFNFKAHRSGERSHIPQNKLLKRMRNIQKGGLNLLA